LLSLLAGNPTDPPLPSGFILSFPLPTAAYVHIPFCRRRCFYCDFAITIVGDRARGDDSPRMAQYVEVLSEEIRQTASFAAPLQSVFFGGGTPSLLSASQLSQILACLDRQFGIASGAEISMEIDPGTFDLAQLRALQAVGMTRFSFGVQAFQAELLQACGRAHTVEDITATMAMIATAGITNYSLDLISGLPNQSMSQWQDSLNQAIAHQPSHLSIYDLTIEAGTVFGKRYQPGDRPLPSDDTTAQMYRLAHEVLTAAGYEHYEISNYAKPGWQCRHNRTYWENRDFYGFGMGATSYLAGDRFARPRHTPEYVDWVQAGLGHVVEPIGPEELLLDTLMLGLRLAEGVSIPGLVEQFGEDLIHRVRHCLQPYVAQGWVEDFGATDRLRLTAPEGFLFSNVMLVALFNEFS
jgi:putative oxygen-independent coproporphyrinogen III oxidase